MSVVDIIPLPGLLTDQANPINFGQLKLHGYEWLSFQVVNFRDPAKAGGIKDYDLAPARSAGLSPGVWGVTYGNADQPDADIFFRDGKLLGAQAVKLGAEHVQMDAEMCAKFTRQGRKMEEIIGGVRAGGWTGPVHLNTLGGPVNPKTAANPGGNDFGMDTLSFTETGGGVIHQDYVNVAPEYNPEQCIAYWKACGVPVARQNVMIDLANEGHTMRGNDWLPFLKDAGVQRNFSIFLAESIVAGDLEALDAFSKKAVAPTVPQPPELLSAISTIANQWLKTRPGPETLSRLRIIYRIARTSGPQWNMVSKSIATILDASGIPK